MASLKVFISSTCYDLGVVRSKLQEFLRSLGYEPVLSEFSDVLFDPRTHTHTSCVDEVINCDMMILLIGSRFGGKAVPEALSRVDFTKLKIQSASTWNLDSGKGLSITQLEVLKALEVRIPAFVFVEEKVMHDHLVYEKNKDKDILPHISFPSIERSDTAQYIFEFINFLRLRNSGNSITSFGHINDIEIHLRKQWSALLQRLLSEQRTRAVRVEQVQNIQTQLEDLKAAILSSIQAPGAREIARGVIRFRTLIDFISAFQLANLRDLVMGNDFSWATFVRTAHIVKVARIHIEGAARSFVHDFVLIRTDDSLLACPWISFRRLIELPEEISTFSHLDHDVREAVWDAWTENSLRRGRSSPRVARSLEEYAKSLKGPGRIEIFDASNLNGPVDIRELEADSQDEPDFSDFGSHPGDDDIPF